MANSRSPRHLAAHPGAPRRVVVRVLLALVYPVLLLLFLFLLSLLFLPSVAAHAEHGVGMHLVENFEQPK